MAPQSLLDRHAVRWRFSGVPVYDDDGHLSGVVWEPAWPIDALPFADQAELGRRIFRAMADPRRPADMSTERVYGMVLSEHGIACPHPAHMREPYHGGATL